MPFFSKKESKDDFAQIGSVFTTRSAVRSAAVTLSAQAAKFILGLAFTAVLARLLTPSDYGIVAMVAVVTGIVAIFKDGGLTVATVQQEDVTHGQVSTLFWINSALGLCLALVIICISPLVGWLYEDTRLVPISVALSLPFLFGGIAAQPTALLQREMRFGAIAVIEIASLVLSGIIGITAAALDWGAWALVTMAVTLGAANATLVFAFCRWRPSRPSRGTGVRAMLRFGGALTANRLLEGLATSLDVILLGRYFSPAMVGLYVRSQTLMLQPLTQLMSPLQSVALPVLSRLASTPAKLDRAFSDLLMVTAVASSFLMTFLVVGADWIVLIFLGDKWGEAASILRLLAGPTLTLPLSSVCVLLLVAQGRGASLIRWTLLKSVVIIASLLLGISWGAQGVALSLSISSVVVLWPILGFMCAAAGPTKLARIWGAAVVATAFASGSVATMLALRSVTGMGSPLMGLILLLAANFALHAALTVAVPQSRGPVWRMIKLALNSLAAEREIGSKALPPA